MTIFKGYPKATICKNGHLINRYSIIKSAPREEYCNKCGEIVINSCVHCKEQINGPYHSGCLFSGIDKYEVPSFCHSCGKPYPWTETKLNRVGKVINEIAELNIAEKTDLIHCITEAAKETSTSIQSALKIKEYLGRIGDAGVLIRDVAVNLLSTSIWNLIWPS